MPQKRLGSLFCDCSSTSEAGLRGGPQYNKQLGEIENYLGDVIAELRNRAVNLAMVGPWQSYNKDQPEGTRIHIDDEALSYCGDKRVEWMVSLIEMIQDFIEHE